jgi:hypothetical protein
MLWHVAHYQWKTFIPKTQQQTTQPGLGSILNSTTPVSYPTTHALQVGLLTSQQCVTGYNECISQHSNILLLCNMTETSSCTLQSLKLALSADINFKQHVTLCTTLAEMWLSTFRLPLLLKHAFNILWLLQCSHGQVICCLSTQTF